MENEILKPSCDKCGEQIDIKYEQKQGKGLPPKDWVKKRGDNRKISWSGTWEIFTCNVCGNEWKKLLK